MFKYLEEKRKPIIENSFVFGSTGFEPKFVAKTFYDKFLRPIQTETKNPKRIYFALEMTQNKRTKSI